MSGKTRSFFLSLTIIAVIIFSAFGTTRVYADGDTPTEPPPTETSSGSEETVVETTDPATEEPAEATAAPEEPTAEEVATEAPAEPTAEATEAPVEATSTEEPTEAEGTATPEPAATESTPTEEAAAPESTEEAAATEETAPTEEATVLDAVPENTTVTIVDENGQAQPLATEAAAEAVATSDPFWCPASVPAGGAGCTPSFTSFTALVNELSAHPELYSGAGTIYIQQGAYLGGESSIELDPVTLSNISGSDLIVNGGWDPATNLPNPATPSTFSNIPIIIGSSTNPWGGSLTLSNIGMSFANNADPTMSGLTLYSTGSITLVNVSVTNAPNDGADLNAGGNVTIVDSKFERNQNTGAKVKSGGAVTAINSSFSNPADARRQDTGLDIENTGAVTLINVLANANRLAGTSINTGGAVDISNSVFSGTKEIQGPNFLGYGLQVVTPGTIDMLGVTANDNFLWGANLQAGGAIAIFTSQFNANTTASPGFIDDTGLFITGGSTVDLQDVTASDNRLYGAKIDAVGAVSINIGDFSNNQGIITTGGVTTFHGHGLAITSQSNISLNNVTALNNMLFGAELSSTVGNVNVSNSTFSNTSTGSAANAVGQGLGISTGGSVILANVVLDNNQTFGATIQARDVTLENVTATNNGSDGIAINALCTSVNGGMFSGNAGHGLNLGTSGLALVAPPTAGDIFPAAPPVCTIVGGNPGTPGDTSGSTTIYAALPINPLQDYTIIPVTDAFTAGSTTNTVTFKSILDKVAGGGFFFGIFTGQYSYIYTDTGLQIFVLVSPLSPTAVRGTFRAY